VSRRRVSATIKDVARDSGVSYSTVSRALNDSPLVNDETKAKIMEVAKRLGYSPNVHAQGLARGRSNMLGFMVPDLRGTLLMEVVEGAEKELTERGFRAMLFHSQWDFQTELSHIEFMRSSRIAGAMLCTIGLKDEITLLRRLQREAFPVVLVDRYFPEVRASHVVTDNEHGGRLATEHLIRRGHREIICLAETEAQGTTSVQDRVKGFRAAAKEGGLGDSSVRVVPLNLHAEVKDDFPTLHALLKENPRPRAIFAINDLFSMALYQVMMHRGLSLQDVDLVGFDDARMAPFMPLPWSSVAQPKERIGRRAAQILVEMVEQGADHIVQESLPPKLIVR